MERQLVYRGSTGTVELRRFFDEVDREFMEGATVTCDLLDANDAAIEGAANLPMAQVAGTAGRDVLYRGAISAALTLPAGNGTAMVTAIATSGNRRRFPVPVRFVD